MIYEICVDSVAGVRAAKAAGADRVELCGDLLEGGTTPSRGTIRQARTVAGIGLNVIIRPRGGDFLFDDDELAIMQVDIDTAKAEGADGVVIGLLTAEGAVDATRMRALMTRARPLSVTFHRAFDLAADPFQALETLVELGVDRVLTSGQEATALEGLPLVAELVCRAGHRIIVMPGGGITARNADRIVATARPREIHFAALEPTTGGMQFQRRHVFMGGELRPPEYDRLTTSVVAIRSVMAKATG
jgi:copper homeostasis protein